MGTGRVPGHILAPGRCLGTYGHHFGAQEHLGTGKVPRFISEQKRCPGI